MDKPKEPTITMTMSEFRKLAEGLLSDYEPRMSRLEKFANRLGRELAEVSNGRATLTLEGEGDPGEGGENV